MERKQFIKSACIVCAGLGSGISLLQLSGCSKLPIYKTNVDTNKVSVPVSLFANSGLQIIRPRELEYDIALQKESNGTFSALLLRCTHADNQLSASDNGYTCNLHGSVFDKEGNVKQGPAEQPLKRFNTQIVNDTIVILIN